MGKGRRDIPGTVDDLLEVHKVRGVNELSVDWNKVPDRFEARMSFGNTSGRSHQQSVIVCDFIVVVANHHVG